MKINNVTTFIIPALILIICYTIFNPIYNGIDDIQWIWMIEGFGYSNDAPANPFFIYQNFLLGYLYQIVPDLLDIFGYNWFHILTQFIFLCSSIYFLKEVKKISWKITISVLTPFFLYLLFMSQYSITPVLLFFSGLVLMGGNKKNNNIISFLGALFIVYSSMVRIEPFYFSVACFFPYAFYFLQSKKQKMYFSISLIIAVVLNFIHLNVSKKQSATKEFFQKTIERKKILDYKGGDYLINTPSTLKDTGLSKNDIKLYKFWFLMDEDINQKITNDVVQNKITPSLFQRIKWGINSILFLKNKKIIFLTLFFLVTLILTRNMYSITSGAIFLFAIFGSGFLGRDPLYRVYIGPLITLSLLNIYFINLNKKNTMAITMAGLFIFFFHNTFQIKSNKILLKKGKAHLNFLLNEKRKKTEMNLYFWSLPSSVSSYLYPIKNFPNIRDLSFTRTGYIWGNANDPQGVKRLSEFRRNFTSSEGATFIFDHLNDRHFAPLIKTYCQERFNKKIHISSVSAPKTNDLHLITFKCL